MLTQITIDTEALGHNVRALKRAVGPGTLVAPVVKGNAYGHGLLLATHAFVRAGADWICVYALEEAERLRAAGVVCPIYILGYVCVADVPRAVELRCKFVLFDAAVLKVAEMAAARLGTQAEVHLKLETGNNRFGLLPDPALALARRVAASPHVTLDGVASHFANIEDTTDHRYAEQQIARLAAFKAQLEAAGITAAHWHMANSAAALLWPERGLEVARVGIASYGLWPSRETLVAVALTGRHPIDLKPALRWTCKIAQIKALEVGEFIGYGCSFRTTHATRLAILPVGYYDGFDRRMGNVGHVLIRGQRAPIRGRICMNITMVDITDIQGVQTEDTAVLLGADGEERVSAEDIATWTGSINYEVTTRIAGHIPRVKG